MGKRTRIGRSIAHSASLPMALIHRLWTDSAYGTARRRVANGILAKIGRSMLCDVGMPTDIPIGALRKDALGVPHIVFFVVAAAAPLTAVVGVTPASFSLGNGPGVPLTFLLVGVLYLLFSAGFTAMSGFVGSCGGFYSYIVAGLGPVAGVAGAMIALATYATLEVGLCGMFGFFLD